MPINEDIFSDLPESGVTPPSVVVGEPTTPIGLSDDIFTDLPEESVSPAPLDGITTPGIVERAPSRSAFGTALGDWENVEKSLPANIQQNYGQAMRNSIVLHATYDIPTDQAFRMNDGAVELLGEADLWTKAGASFKAGFGDAYATFGNALLFAGANEEFANTYIDYGERLRMAFIPPVDTSEFTFDKVGDPEWWATTVTRSVPFTLSLIPAAIVGAYGGSVVAGLAGMGAFGTTVLSSIGAAAVSRPIEAAFEAGNVREEGIRRGMTVEQADKAAGDTFKNNLALGGLDAAQMAIAFTPLKFGKGALNPALGRRVAAGAGKLAVVGATEAGEERYQEVISATALGDEIDFFDPTDPRLNEASTIGGLFGLGLGGAGSVWTGLRDRATAEMPEEVKQTYDEALAGNLDTGVPQEQAEARALDTVAETPEGEEHIKTVFETLKENGEKIQTAVTEARAKLAQQDIPAEEGVKIISQTISEQLEAAGHSAEEAKLLGEVFGGAAFETMAARGGVDPLDLFEDLKLQIQTEEIAETELTKGVTFDQSGQIITDTPEFQEFFRGSKVVDEEGAPLIVYHGTIAPDFEAFEKSRDIGFHFGTQSQANTFLEEASTRIAKEGKAPFLSHVTPRALPVYLDIKNPLRMEDAVDWDAEKIIGQLSNNENFTEADIENIDNRLAPVGIDLNEKQELAVIRNWLKEKGYDGIVYENIIEGLPSDIDRDSYIAFEPTQIKSVFNRGAFDPTDPRILFQPSPRPAPVFFSQTQSIVEGPKFPTKASGETMMNILRKSAKAEEIKWSGIEDFLKGKKAATKEEVLEFLKVNQVQVEDVVKGPDILEAPDADPIDTSGWAATSSEIEVGDWDVFNEVGDFVQTVSGDSEQDAIDGAAANAPQEFPEIPEAETKFSEYTLPGGEDYTELLLTLPGLESPERVAFQEFQERMRHFHGGNFTVDDLTVDQEAERQELAKAGALSPELTFTSSHFDEPNIVAHIRFDTRTDAEGNKVLFLEEIQSDWAAKGRKEGFKSTTPEGLQESYNETKQEFNDFRNELAKKYDKHHLVGSGAVVGDFKDIATPDEIEQFRLLQLNRDSLGRELDAKKSGVPSAPLLKSWHELALKRMLRYAAENDFDKMAWISGEQTADRYDLSKQVDQIRYTQNDASNFNIEILKDRKVVIKKDNQTHSDIETLVGKDITKKIESGEGKELFPDPKFPTMKSLSGVDLKVGGEWAFTLYDKVIPNFLKKYGKKWGAKVGKVDIEQVKATEENPYAEVKTSQQSIPITESMKGAVLEVGQPLFQPGPRRPRASVEGILDDLGINITLMKNFDRSSFIHEIGHVYFRLLDNLAKLPTAEASLKEDLDTVMVWVGGKPGDSFAGLTEEQHEKWARGFEAYIREGKAPSSALRKAFEEFKVWLTDVYRSLRRLNVELTQDVREVMERMLASQEDIEAHEKDVDLAVVDMVAEGKNVRLITNADIKKILPRTTIKGKILESVGARQKYKTIREDEALSAAWKKAEQSARKAFKAGKEAEAAKHKQKLRDVIARADAKVAKIKTEKQKATNRRRQVKTIIDFLNLTDGQVKKLLQRKNITLMSDWEFKQFKDNMLVRAGEMQETAFATALVQEAIQSKRLQNTENYRRAMNLPPISKMSIEQLGEYAEALEPYEDGDVFLTQRELETVDNTDLKGIRTWREAKERLAKEAGVPIEELQTVKVSWTDKFKWDNALAESNPFYKLLVTEINKRLLNAEMRVHNIEDKVFELARASEKSRGLKITEKLIPQDPQIIAYLETTPEDKPTVAAEMTKEQLDFANFMQEYFGQALEYLVQTKSLDKGRENYFVHIRRSFLETLKDDGLIKAVASMYQNYVQDEAVFNILDEDTGNILPLEKFFQFSLRRTGGLVPTQNVVKAFLVYAQTFEKKRSLDEIIPKLDIYAQSITPRNYTPRGLEIDRSIKKFVNKFVNNKKGRNIDMGFVKQGDKVDLTIRAMRTFTSLLDLGLNIPTGVAAFVGERAANFTLLGEKGVILGSTRARTKKGKAIIEEHEGFVGRSAFEEFKAPGKEIGERIFEVLFGLFHQATVSANKQFFLASLSKEEWASGKVSDDRLAALRIEMGRLRVVPGAKSLVGSTSVGGAGIQYKTWAVPIARTMVVDIGKIVSDLKSKPAGEALTTREAREVFRAIRLTALVILVLGVGDRDDKSFIGQLSYKARREALTVVQAISPDMWLSTPRIMGFMSQLGKNLKSLVLLEEFKTKEGLKGVGGLKRQFTPAVVRQTGEEKPRPRAR